MTKFNHLFALLYTLSIGTFGFAQVANDMCTGAIDLTSSLGQGIGVLASSGPYDNSDATSGADDPIIGWECFAEPDGGGANPSLDNTVWFKITGDGGSYFLEATIAGCSVSNGITFNDTQIAVYTGTCNNLTPFTCNDDGPNASSSDGNFPAAVTIQTEAGVDYFILVDGFLNPGGNNSVGEFCMQFTGQVPVLCNDPNVGVGTVTVLQDVLCQPEDNAATFAVSEAFAPDVGAFSGYIWIFSTQDLAGTTDPVNAPGFLGAFPFSEVLTDTVELNFVTNNLPPDQYFATLYVLGNATADAAGNLTFDPDCTFVSNSAEVNYFAANEQICLVGIPEVDEAVLGMTVFPNPVQDLLNLNINITEYSEATIMITNVAGQMIRQKIVNLQNGENILNINLDNAVRGIYIVSVETSSHQAVSRFIKQ